MPLPVCCGLQYLMPASSIPKSKWSHKIVGGFYYICLCDMFTNTTSETSSYSSVAIPGTSWNCFRSGQQGHKPKTKSYTYLLLPARRCGWPLLPGSSWPHTHSCRRPVCCGGRARCAGRRVSRWAGAFGASADCPGLSPRAHRPCTTP